MTAAQSHSNTPEWTVSELSGALKRTLEGEFGHVRVRAEVSGYRGAHSSGHAYFCLKDQGARIDAVCWRTTFARLRLKPSEGMEVVVTGKITTFPGKSAYQIVVESIEPAGVGALMALLEERRKQLSAEGLFDAARKRPIPFLPQVVGVVTSPTGAVIRDILHRIAERFPCRVLIWPVRVQGEGSTAELVRAIEGFNAMGPRVPARSDLPRPDVLIVARGGGSIEDLWSFNDEAVVRAVAASALPVIAAVGHETDWTLIDHAADLRAPTPTGAAEKCVPVRLELLRRVSDLGLRTSDAAARLLARARSEFRGAARALPTGEAVIGVSRQRMDASTARLTRCLDRTLDARRRSFGALSARLAAQSPQARMVRASARLEVLELRLQRAVDGGRDNRQRRLTVVAARLQAALGARSALARHELVAAQATVETAGRRLLTSWQALLDQRAARLQASHQLLGSLGYRNVLARGFALARDPAGVPVRSVRQLSEGMWLDLEFADGHAKTIVGSPDKASAARARPVRAKGDPEKQGTLF